MLSASTVLYESLDQKDVVFWLLFCSRWVKGKNSITNPICVLLFIVWGFYLRSFALVNSREKQE